MHGQTNFTKSLQLNCYSYPSPENLYLPITQFHNPKLYPSDPMILLLVHIHVVYIYIHAIVQHWRSKSPRNGSIPWIQVNPSIWDPHIVIRWYCSKLNYHLASPHSTSILFLVFTEHPTSIPPLFIPPSIPLRDYDHIYEIRYLTESNLLQPPTNH